MKLFATPLLLSLYALCLSACGCPDGLVQEDHSVAVSKNHWDFLTTQAANDGGLPDSSCPAVCLGNGSLLADGQTIRGCKLGPSEAQAQADPTDPDLPVIPTGGGIVVCQVEFLDSCN